MNIWHTLVLTVKHAVAAVLVFVGLQAAPAQPQTTVVDVQPDTAAVTVTTSPATVPIQVGQTKIETSQTPAVSGAVFPSDSTTVPTTAEAPQAAPQPVVVPVYIIQQPTSMTETVTGQPAPTPAAAAPAPSYTLEVVSPMPIHGLGRKFIANDGTGEVLDANSVDFGVILRDGSGQPVKTAIMTMTASDPQQGQRLVGTGDLCTIYPNGERTVVPCYMFHYDFKTAGDHTLTITTETGESTILNLHAN